MGRITRVLSNSPENRVKADRNGGDINDMEHLQPLGDDSKPLPQDDGWSDRTSENGNDVYFGAFDYGNKIAGPGEKRTYARNADGVPVSHVYQKDDGTIIIANDSYSKTINPDGSYVETNGTYEKVVNADGSWSETNGAYTKSVDASGAMTETNGSGTKTLGTDGSFDFNGFVIGPNGLVKDSSGIGLDSHSHTQGADSAGNSQVRTDSASE
ncbi:hypothetical protein MYOV065v1_p0046 [Vibrio phage PS15B.2]|nr:hypothetical protein MYOV065v1_p0046 [Vibrio phage PS15B.2]QZI90815.1 hypothetical protein MYOV066v1_p0037 [Vibrio phage PS15B.3]QZI90897.1 hypothetical protein MYOV064v1_p0047 [Vibrio phage PS15B.4]